MVIDIKRGDIVIVDLDPSRGSEQKGIRPALIIQNNLGNKYSPTTIIAPITSQTFKKEFPTNVNLPRNESKLEKDSIILFNQTTAIDKSRIIKKISTLEYSLMKKVDLAIKVSLGLD